MYLQITHLKIYIYYYDDLKNQYLQLKNYDINKSLIFQKSNIYISKLNSKFLDMQLREKFENNMVYTKTIIKKQNFFFKYKTL